MDDESIIALFLDRSENAIAELTRKYGKLALSISENILGNRSDAEECLNDSLLSVWDTVPPCHPSPLCAYFCRIVRNTSLDRIKYNSAEKRNASFDSCIDETEVFLASAECVEDEVSEKELARYIDLFLDTQNAENRIIFVRRFWYADPYKTIAADLGLRTGTVKTRMTRMRAELRDYLATKGITI